MVDDYRGIELAYIPQCAVCKHVNGKGCKALDTDERDAKFYDSKHKDFSKCGSFELNKSKPKAERFKELSKEYGWK